MHTKIRWIEYRPSQRRPPDLGDGKRYPTEGIVTYNAYSRCDGTTVSHAEYDADAGIHGRLTKKPETLGASGSLDAAVEIAYAHLGRKPSDAVYIADDDDLIHDMIFNDGYHAEQANNEKWLCSSITLLILCVTSFTASTFAGLGLSGLVSFCAVSVLYILITRTGIQNEVEGGVVCFIILVLLLLLLPAMSAARDAYQRRNAADNNAVHTKDGIARLPMEHQLAVPGDG